MVYGISCYAYTRRIIHVIDRHGKLVKLNVTQDPNCARKTELARVAHGLRPNAASILYVSRESSSVPSSRPCAHHRFVSGESTKVCVSDPCSHPTELMA